jgi:putative ABC transport system ATP-binding protein
MAVADGCAVAAALVLELRGVTKLRGESPQQFQLEVPSFFARPGEFVAIVGASGCGKSTLMDMLALISRPDSCEYFALSDATFMADIAAAWRDGDESRMSDLRSRRIGYVLQTGGLLPFLTVAQNAELVMRLAGQPEANAQIATLASRLGIASELAKKPQQLSGGQRQRAAILRSLVHRPALVLADEPTAAVDKTRASRIVKDFSRIAQEEGATVVMVTHDLDLVAGVAHRHYSFTLREEPGVGNVSTCAVVAA